MKRFILTLIILLNIGFSYSQTDELSQQSKRFNVSILFPALSFFGPNNAIEEGMKTAGLTSTKPNVLGGTIDYPLTKKRLIFDIEASYSLSKKNAISLNAGLADNVEVIGSSFETMNVFCKTWSFSVNYSYSRLNHRHTFSLGPSFLIQIVDVYFYTDKSYKDFNINPGIYIGYGFQMIQKKHWFLMFKSNYRWAPKVEIGPYDYQFNTDSHPVQFLPTKIRMASLNVGLAIGIRIGKS